jgi:hypothetical protein
VATANATRTAAVTIPALTGTVLVVNARMGEQQRPSSSPAG